MLALNVVPGHASVPDNVGYTRLRVELGDSMPTGAGLHAIQVESPITVQAGAGEVRTWAPNLSSVGLRDQPVVEQSGAPKGAHSGHATAVARYLVGNAGMGMAFGVQKLEIFEVSDWLGNGHLLTATPLVPRKSPARVISHSWIAGMDTPLRGGLDSRILRRVDWLADRDEVISVAGIGNGPNHVNKPLMAAAYNIIVVGRSDGAHYHSTPAVDSLYVADRIRPHLVAPLPTTSAAAPVVASAALVLLQVAADPALSTRSAVHVQRAGTEFRDAGRPEVLRAILMAAADRRAVNSGYQDIKDYGLSLGVNGLDPRYGAGQLNIYKAWQLLSSGEQEAGHKGIKTTGFDYVESFGEGKRSRHYDLAVSERGTLAATLSWQLLFPGRVPQRFDASAVLNNLDLCLFRITDEGEELVAAATSKTETTENIFRDLAPGRYRLAVDFVDGQAPQLQDYALAWQFEPAATD